jgi:hypothetical protein
MNLSAIIPLLRSRGLGVRALSKGIREQKITFVSRKKLRRLAQAIFTARSANQQGIYLEAGVALGGTAVMIARLKPTHASLELYDVFGMIPPPSDKDDLDAVARYDVIANGQAKGIDGDMYYGYLPDVKQTVVDNLARFGIDPKRDHVKLVEGVFEETLSPRDAVTFAHIDCDWYDSVVTCIERIWPRLSRGGVMLFDDYRSYEGCRKAVDEFIARTPDCEILFSDVSFGVKKIGL